MTDLNLTASTSLSTSTEFVLQHPVSIGPATYTVLTCRRPKVKDIAAMDVASKDTENSAELTGAIVLISLLAGIPISVVDELDVEDFTKLSEHVLSFLPK